MTIPLNYLLKILLVLTLWGVTSTPSYAAVSYLDLKVSTVFLFQHDYIILYYYLSLYTNVKSEAMNN